MKIVDGKFMKSHEIRQNIEEAKHLLALLGISSHFNSEWMKVRDWARKARSTRNPRQFALSYLDRLAERLGG